MTQTENDSLFAAMAELLQWQSSLWEIIGLSLQVSLSSTLIASLIGLPLGALLATQTFRGHKLVVILVNTLMALPSVVVGLFVYLMLSRSGPLGIFGLLYTPAAMIIAQSILITPLVVALGRQHMHAEWGRIGEQLCSLGKTGWAAVKTLVWEVRLALSTVMLAAFGRAVTEIGAVMIVGGNIEHATRVMTTSIAMETSKGNLELALALGVVLLVISLIVNLLVYGVGAASNGRAFR